MGLSMTNQWQGLLKNLGQWVGSFANYSMEGRLTDEVPSQLTLQLSEDQQSIGLCLNRYPKDRPTNRIELGFKYPGPGPQIPFFEQGAFSQGPLQYSRFSQFGAELSLIWGDRRLRIVQQYPSGAEWAGLTLICETRTNLPPSPRLTIEHLCGEWIGEAQSLFPDSRDAQIYTTRLTIERTQNQLLQSLAFAEEQIQSTGDIAEDRVDFLDSPQPMRLLLLPGGGSSLCPLSIQSGQRFFLEAGWLIEPTLRQRLIRCYGPKGEWNSLTLVTERKQ
jgi:hypothetical protein